MSEKSGAVPTLQTPYKQRPHPASPGSARNFQSDGLLTLPAQYVEQGLCNGRASVRPSVRPIDRQQQRWPAALLLSALRAGDIDR